MNLNSFILGTLLLFFNLSLFAQSQIGSDIDGENAGDYLGSSVSISSDGNTLAIGAPGFVNSASDTGHVKVYKNTNGSWTQVGSDIDGEAAGDYFGSSVSISSDGNILAIGAWKNDGNGSQA